MRFRVDTVIPASMYKLFNGGVTVPRPDQALFGPGRERLRVKGVVITTLWKENESTHQDVYVVEDLRTTLLDRTAIQTLGLVRMVGETPKRVLRGVLRPLLSTR